MRISDATTLLARTPAAVSALLDGLPDEWLHRDDGPDTWSAYAIAGHLLHGDEANWLPRIQLIAAHGTGRTFEPFDRVAMLSWERETVASLLQRFRSVRADRWKGWPSLHRPTFPRPARIPSSGRSLWRRCCPRGSRTT